MKTLRVQCLQNSVKTNQDGYMDALKTKGIALVLLSVLFVFTSCSLAKPIEIQGVNSLKISEGSGSKGVLLTANLQLFNPNGFPFRVNSADIDVYAEGIHLGKLGFPETIEMGAKNTFSGDFYIEISIGKLLFSGKNILPKLKSGNIELQLKGKMDTHFLWTDKKFDIDYTEKITLK